MISPQANGSPTIPLGLGADRKSTRLNSSHLVISYAGFCLKKKNSVRCIRHCPSSQRTQPCVAGVRTVCPSASSHRRDSYSYDLDTSRSGTAALKRHVQLAL